ncbi:Wzz/FepE/Etk N-terminal domain-containing protein [Pseudomonas sp. FGI182]|uniref:Wzz/FepE/Etk N-terminal domain-containing protein n=1 Tax=Pseudomonas sp. FGI182 TaxID=1259844 RepID=UPI0012DBF4C1
MVTSGVIDLSCVLRTIWHRRLLIVDLGGVCVLVGAAVAYSISPVYEASTSLRFSL